MLNRKRLTFIILLLIAILSVRFLPGCGDGLNILTEDDSGKVTTQVEPPVDPPIEPPIDPPVEPPVDPPVDPPPPPPPVDPWSDFSYRRSITITNSGTSQTLYQINIILNSSNFSFANADPEGDDIRIRSGDTSIDYWIESWDSIGETASVWVKVPSIPGGDTVLYIYYGDTSKTSESDFNNTFTKDSGFAGLAARWHMDEGIGTSIDDSSANGNDGTVTDATWSGSDGGTWYTGISSGFSTGDSLGFNRTDNEYITVPDNDSFDVGKITIALWFKVNRVDIGQHFVSKWKLLGDNLSYSLSLNSDKVRFETSFNGSASDSLQGTYSVSSGSWYHLAATFNGLSKKIYINGSLKDSTDITGDLNITNTAALTIGTVNIDLGSHLDGLLDEVSIYNTALSADQIKALSQRRKYSTDIGATPVVGTEEVVP